MGPDISISCSSIKPVTRPALSSVSITFLDTKNRLDVISFQNFYVASIAVYQLHPNGNEVCILENKQLMKKPNCENGGQSYHQIYVNSEFNENYVEFLPLKLYMFQPSTHWNKIEIKNIRCHTKPVCNFVNISQMMISDKSSTSESGIVGSISDTFIELTKILESKRANASDNMATLSAFDGDRKSTRMDKRKKRGIIVGAVMDENLTS